jgi:hypothetical protein
MGALVAFSLELVKQATMVFAVDNSLAVGGDRERVCRTLSGLATTT